MLLVSTSNAAVDVAVKAVLKHLRPDEQAAVVRLGTTLDPEVVPLTPMGRLATRSVTLARQVAEAQVRLRQVRELLRPRTLSPERVARLLAEAAGCEERITRFHTEATTPTPFTPAAKGSLTACTLARMVLDADLRASRFDVVVVDEASMAPLLLAVAASLLAGERVVYAGDPKQLPPIV